MNGPVWLNGAIVYAVETEWKEPPRRSETGNAGYRVPDAELTKPEAAWCRNVWRDGERILEW